MLSVINLLTPILFFAVPTVLSAYLLFRQLGSDHATMAAIMIVQTIPFTAYHTDIARSNRHC